MARFGILDYGEIALPTKKADVKRQVEMAIAACEAKKADDLRVLELDKSSGGFTDYFVICTGGNPRQIQAISDEVELRLGVAGLRPTHVEGYRLAEWVLLDYVDFVVHVFSPKARHFYNLERLWKSAKHLAPSELRVKKRPRKKASPSPRTASARTRRRKRKA